MDDLNVMGWIHVVIGAILLISGSILTVKREFVQVAAERKYTEAAAKYYSRFAGPLEMCFALGLIDEGLVNAGILPNWMLAPGLALAGACLLAAVCMWLFILRKNEKKDK